MGFIIGHKIDHGGVEARRDERHAPSNYCLRVDIFYWFDVSLNLLAVTGKVSVLYWHNNVFTSIIPQTANDKFVKEKQSGRAVTERETMLKDLATAYDIYMELLGNLQEGTKVK